MRELTIEERDMVGGGDKWAGTPEGQAPGPTAQAAIDSPQVCLGALLWDSMFGTQYFKEFACDATP